MGEVHNLQHLANAWGLELGVLPTQYLGLNLGSDYKATIVWNAVIERFEKRLAGWNRGRDKIYRRGQTYTYEVHIIKSAHIFHVFIPHSGIGREEIG